MPSIAVLGAAYSANKGAASMVQSLLDNLPARLPGAELTVVSTHPADDRAAYARAGIDVSVVSQQPVEMALVQVPIALIAGVLRVLRLPYRWLLRPPALRALADADVVADLSGISFVDGRRFVVLVYNALVVGVPLALGTPVVKCAQAMGPFETTVNRRLAGLVLPRLARVCPRGDVTASFVEALGLTNLTPASDLAFAMQVPESVRESVAARLAGVGPYVVVSPSQVVATSSEARGIDYPRITAEVIDRLVEETGRTVVLVAHSAQPGRGVTHLNDLPLCRDVARRVRNQDCLLFLDEDLLPTELRAIIGGADVLVTSRFHAMISALCEQVPPVVIGWSHKYGEVVDRFGLADLATTFEELGSSDPVLAKVQDVLARREELVARIAAALPEVRASAETNVDVLVEVLRSGR